MPTVTIVPAPPSTLLISVVEVTGIGVVSSTETEDFRDPHVSILSFALEPSPEKTIDAPGCRYLQSPHK
jgi:hypothetical protein